MLLNDDQMEVLKNNKLKHDKKRLHCIEYTLFYAN